MFDEEENQQRSAVIAEALTWLDTPFHHHAAVKGAGVDCLHFLYAPFFAVGLIPDVEIPEYSPQWFANRNEDRLIEAIQKMGASEIAGPPSPADVVVVKVGRVYAHGAIVVEWPKIIHANPDQEKVKVDRADIYPLFCARPVKFFSLWSDQHA